MKFRIFLLVNAICFGTISGLMKRGWTVVGLYLLFAIGYSYIPLLGTPLQIN